MSEDEISNILDELNKVRPEILNEESKRLFEAIMQIANDRDKYINLYNKEKEKNKKLTDFIKEDSKDIHENYIHKDKIREKIKDVKIEGTKQYWTEEVEKILIELLEETNE